MNLLAIVHTPPYLSDPRESCVRLIASWIFQINFPKEEDLVVCEGPRLPVELHVQLCRRTVRSALTKTAVRKVGTMYFFLFRFLLFVSPLSLSLIRLFALFRSSCSVITNGSMKSTKTVTKLLIFPKSKNSYAKEGRISLRWFGNRFACCRLSWRRYYQLSPDDVLVFVYE